MLNVTIISMHAPYSSDTLLAITPIKCAEKQNAVAILSKEQLYGLSEFVVVI